MITSGSLFEFSAQLYILVPIPSTSRHPRARYLVIRRGDYTVRFSILLITVAAESSHP